MSPRARRSESITLPPGRHPILGHGKDGKTQVAAPEYPSEKTNFDGHMSESDLDEHSDTSYDDYDSLSSSHSSI